MTDKATYSALPLAITSAPERIWLDLGFNPYEEDAHFSNLHDLTWSNDNATGDGIEYVRADRAMRAQAAPAAVAGLHSGWRFGVNRSDGRVWLTISTPHGASATLSAAEKTGNGDDTIVAQVLDYLADSLSTPAAVAGPSEFPYEQMDAMALARYKVVPSNASMFWSHAVAAGDGTQQLYVGRETECQNMARKFAGAFLDGAFEFHSIAAAPTTQAAPQPAGQQGDVCRRCKGSGEDPEGYYDQSRGPDGNTYDGPCRVCAGTGAHPAAPAAQGDALIDAASFASDVLAEVYAKYQPKIGPFASQAQLANVRLRDAIKGAARSQAKEGGA